MQGPPVTDNFMRRVVAAPYVGACRYTGYVAKSRCWKLECGHERWHKASVPVPQMTYCQECERLHDRRQG